MKLQKWKCRSCGFEWFEPSEPDGSYRNINHGCPQGCDDAGRIVDTVEATDSKHEWICWILSKGDIDSVANRIGVSAKSLTEDNCEDIARNFEL